MTKATFNYIWRMLIIDISNDLFLKIAEVDRDKFSLKMGDMTKLKKAVFRDYCVIKNDLKRDYYDNITENDERNLIDQHKIAACICFSLIKNKIFSFKTVRETPIEICWINYELAFVVSLGFLYMTLIQYYTKINREDIVEKLMKQATLVLPATTSPKHDDYKTGRIKCLALNDVYENCFDVIDYSDILFWIEYYNKQLLEGNLIEN